MFRVLRNILLIFLIGKINAAEKIPQIEALHGIISKIPGSKAIYSHLPWKNEEKLEFYKQICIKNGFSCDFSGIIPSYAMISSQILVFDFKFEETKEFLRTFYMKDYQKLYWIFLNVNEEEKEFLDLFKNQNLGPISEVFYVTSDQNGDHVKQPFKMIPRSKNVTIEHFGHVSNHSFTDLRKTSISSRRRKNFHGSLLRLTMVYRNNSTLEHLDDYRETHIDSIGKVSYQCVKHLISYFNASSSILFTQSWGYYDQKNKTWDGMVRYLLDDHVDVAITPFLLTTSRFSVIEYIGKTSKTTIYFVFQSPKLSYTDDIFILPFSDTVWFCLIGFFFVLVGLFTFSIYVEWKIPIKTHEKSDPQILQPNLLDNLHLVFTAMCQQGSPTTPRSFSSKFIMLLIFGSLFFLYSSYSANIVALLQAPSNKIKTLEDLYNSKMELAMHDTIYARYFAPKETVKINKMIYENRILKGGKKKPNFLPLEEGVEQIRKGLFAFYFESGPGYKVMQDTYDEHEKCGLQEISYLHVSDTYLGVQKNSSYRDFIKIALIRLSEHGLTQRENLKIYTSKPKCAGNVASFVPVSILDVQPAFFWICWGLGIAGFLFIMEILAKRSFNKVGG